MFAYCTERLHLSDAEAYLRIAAARASREHPVLLEMLADGRLHLTAIAKLAPHLTPQNREELLERATHRTKREIEELVAEIAPRPDAATVVRRLPERRAATSCRSQLRRSIRAPPLRRVPPTSPGASRVASTDSGGSAEVPVPSGNCVQTRAAAGQPERSGLSTSQWRRHRPAVVEPLAPGRYRVQFTASAELRDKLERLRGLLRSSVPDGDLGTIIEQAVTETLERLESRRFARTKASEKPLPARNTSSSGRAPSATARESAPAAARGPRDRRGRSGGEPEASGRGPLLCGGEPSLSGGQRHPPRDAPHPGRDQASRVRARRRTMPLRGRTGPAMHRARRAGVPPPASVRLRRAPLRGRDLPAVPGPQPLPGRDRLRAGGHGPAPALEDGVGGSRPRHLIPQERQRPGVSTPHAESGGARPGCPLPRRLPSPFSRVAVSSHGLLVPLGELPASSCAAAGPRGRAAGDGGFLGRRHAAPSE